MQLNVGNSAESQKPTTNGGSHQKEWARGRGEEEGDPCNCLTAVGSNGGSHWRETKHEAGDGE